jgi:hypothetical protein
MKQLTRFFLFGAISSLLVTKQGSVLMRRVPFTKEWSFLKI